MILPPFEYPGQTQPDLPYGLSEYLRKLKANQDLLIQTVNGLNLEASQNLSSVQSSINTLALRRRNLIINGLFRIRQRGVTFNIPSVSSAMVADRFLFTNNTDGALGVSDPGGYPDECGVVSKSVLAQVTTADASLAAGQYAAFLYRGIEGYELSYLLSQYVTLSFWVYATVTGTYSVALRNAGPDRSYVAEYTVNNSQKWEKKVITFKMHSGSGGTWNFTNGRGLDIWWTFACGSTLQAAPNIWNSGSYISSPNQVNGMGAVNNVFALGAVQFEPGQEATPLEFRYYEEDLALCQRYCEKSYRPDVYPNSGDGYGMWLGTVPVEDGYVSEKFKVNKRTLPTITFYSYINGSTNNAYDLSIGADAPLIDAAAGETGFYSRFNTSGAPRIIGFHWVADAEFS